MKEGRICIAGLDEHTNEHVRPTTGKADPLARALLHDNGGPVRLGAMIDIGDATPMPTLPESEDHRTTTRDLQRVGALDGDQYLDRLSRISGDCLEAVFGPALQRATPWKYAVDEGHGSRSLGAIRMPAGCRLDADTRFGGVTLMFREDGKPVYTRVADARFFDDQGAVDQGAADDVARRLRWGTDGYVMLGLSRAFAKPGDDRRRHWLQVNGICLEDRPLG